MKPHKFAPLNTDQFVWTETPPAYQALQAVFDAPTVGVAAWGAASVAADIEALALYGDDPAIMGVAP